MLDSYKELELINNTAGRQFELKIGELTAFIEYRQTPEHITLIHTEVPQELEGKGAGTAIIEKTLDYIEKNNLKLVPLCPFVVVYLKRHPEWKRVLADGVKNV